MANLETLNILESALVVPVLALTDAAAEKVQGLLAERKLEGYGLRVFVAGGGCSGMQYGMGLEAEPRDYDTVMEVKGVKVFIDPTSMTYIEGCTIDYVESLMGGGFKVDNPNAVSTCGCGHSFRTEGSAGAAEGASCGC